MISLYDYETLSVDAQTVPVLSVATLTADPEVFVSDTPYGFMDLVEMTKFMKFDIAEQVKDYGAKVDPSTVKWWGEQSIEARQQIRPRPDDKSITELIPFLKKELTASRVYSRGCSFEHPITTSVAKRTGQEPPYKFWSERDTRSYIEGLSNDEVKNNFIPDNVKELFIAHDPQYDVAIDAYRIQVVKRAILGLD